MQYPFKVSNTYRDEMAAFLDMTAEYMSSHDGKAPSYAEAYAWKLPQIAMIWDHSCE